MLQKYKQEEVKEGETITLHCPIEEKTSSEIIWTKNGIPITTSPKVQVGLRKLFTYMNFKQAFIN